MFEVDSQPGVGAISGLSADFYGLGARRSGSPASFGGSRTSKEGRAIRGSRPQHLAAKRCLDLVVSLLAIVLLLPLFLALCIAIPLDSAGSPFFSQTRWGKDGRRIRVYKFRSMRTDLCDATGVAQTMHDDPRVTRLGFWLRRLNIDELPQLLNVLKGDMSLVGPRCHAIGMMAGGVLYEELVPGYHKRHAVRPGLTGLAQMRGLRGPTVDPGLARARIACDLHYVRTFNLWLDVRILFGTVVAELRGGKGF